MDMNNEWIDPRNKAFAEYLGCEVSMIDDTYYASQVGLVPDNEEAQDTAKAIAIYRKAINEFERFRETLEKLPELELVSFQIQKAHWSETIQPLKDGLQVGLMVAQNRKKLASGKGPINHRANAVAEFVACVFDRLEWPVTFGCRAADDEPSTRFGRAVKECFIIYDVRLPPKISEHHRKLGNQSATTFHLTETGALAHWKRPAEAAYRQRDQRNA